MELQTTPKNKRVQKSANRTVIESKARRALLDAGLSAQDVAKRCKVGVSTVNAWCVGRRSIPDRYATDLRDWKKIPVAAWLKLGE